MQKLGVIARNDRI